MIWATVSSWSCFCWVYRAFPSLAAKNIINLTSVLTIWWCPCVESSLVSFPRMSRAPPNPFSCPWSQPSFIHLSLRGWMFYTQFNYIKSVFFFFMFRSSCMAFVISSPWLGMEPMLPALEAWILNHWTTREVPTTNQPEHTIWEENPSNTPGLQTCKVKLFSLSLFFILQNSYISPSTLFSWAYICILAGLLLYKLS